MYTSEHIATSGWQNEQFYMTTYEFGKDMLKAKFVTKIM